VARPRTKFITLTEEERITLEKISTSRTEPMARVIRAKAILMSANDINPSDISTAVNLSKVSISKLVNKCIAFGAIKSLDDLPRSGRKPIITDDDKTYVKHIACTKPKEFKYSEELWTQEKLAKHIRENCVAAGYPNLVNINKSMVWKILDADGIKPFRIRYYLERRDPDFDVKMKKVLMVYKEVQVAIETEQNTGVVTLSFDEKPGIQALGSTVEDQPVSEEHGFIGRDSDYIRYGTVSLLAGLNLITGEVVPLVSESHNSDDFITFLKKVDAKYPQAEHIRIVLDNLKTHSSRQVMEYLNEKPGRFEFVFTPKHGSWLNLVESFFGKMSRAMLRGIRVKSKQELIDRIYAYIDEVNAEPVVYRWTYRMDEIEV